DQRSFQIRESDVLAHHESLHLIELDLRTCSDLLITETHSWQRNADRRWIIRVHGRVLPHRMDLSRRRMCPQQNGVVAALACFHKECILHITRGMVRGEVKQLEIDLICFHFERGVNLKTHTRQNIQHAAQLLCGWMQSSYMDTTPWQGHIQRIF